jgi:hypothetical protein
MHMRFREPFPQGLKPAFFAGLIGTAEAVPFHRTSFHKSVYESSSIYLGEHCRSGLVLTSPVAHLFLQEGNLL